MKSKNTDINHRLTKQSRQYVDDLTILFSLPQNKKLVPLVVQEFPFDHELVTASRLYQKSRKFYLALGGIFLPKVTSMMRSLRAQDLFKNEINYTPARSEMHWFHQNLNTLEDTNLHIEALRQFTENSLYHEQNHRIVWKLLPPAPADQAAFRRYLNFAESLVVMLDLALGDELGSDLSCRFENMNVIFRPSSEDGFCKKAKSIYRKYLLSLFLTTYYALELIHHDDILKAVDYIFPKQKQLNKKAVQRGLELSELFTLNTNPQWQSLYWKQAQLSLRKLNQAKKEDPLIIATDPLDLNYEFAFVRSILSHYGL